MEDFIGHDTQEGFKGHKKRADNLKTMANNSHASAERHVGFFRNNDATS